MSTTDENFSLLNYMSTHTSEEVLEKGIYLIVIKTLKTKVHLDLSLGPES